MLKNGLPLLILAVALPAFAADDPTLTDGKAEVRQVQGHVVLAKKGSPLESVLKKGDKIEAGDTVTTGMGASVSIVFDKGKKNAVQIPADSKAVFLNIEPTDIKLESGSVFNVVDGLAQGSTWKITTPSTVAAVRGTVFLVSLGFGGEFYSATLDIPDDGKDSAIEIKSLTDGGTVNLIEGKELRYKTGEILSTDLISAISPAMTADVMSFYREILGERPQEKEEETMVAAPLAQYTERICDASGNNCTIKTCTKTSGGEDCTYA